MEMRSSFVYSLTKGVARLLFSAIYRIETQREGPAVFKGPAIILPKHQYWTDIPLVALSFDFPVSFVAKRELFRYPWIRSLLKSLGAIPLDREHPIRTFSSIRDLVSRLKGVEKIVIFPEGTYVREAVGSGKSRLIQMILSLQAGLKERVPFVPVGIRYRERSGWRRPVEIRIGTPLFAEKGADILLLTRRVMEEIGRLSRLPVSDRNNEFGVL
jgi:1-acyl-sn-glycerol-3-phosphate acyltransferase